MRDAVQEAIDRWEAKNGWKADYAVVQGFQIVVDEQYADMLAQIREYEHALEHVIECGSCDDCKRLAQSAIDGVGREDFKDWLDED